MSADSLGQWGRRGALMAILILGLLAGVGSADTGDLQVAISEVTATPADPYPGERTTVRVTVRNAQASSSAYEVTDVYLRGGRELTRVEDLGTVPVGGTLTVPLAITFDDPGTRDLRVHVRGEDANGDTRTLQYPLAISVDEHDEPVIGIDQGRPIAGVDETVNVSISNVDDRALDRLSLTLDGTGVDIRNPRRFTLQLAGTAEQRYTMPLRFTRAGSVELNATATYRLRTGESRTVTERFRVQVDEPADAPRLGRIRLTGIDIQPGADHVTITGSASNVGLTAANSVVVRVVETDGVTPVSPNREYFVGTVPGSDFVSFDLTARVDPAVTAIPIEVTYLADGIERSETVSIPVDQGALARPTDQSGGAGPGGTAVAALLALVVVVGTRYVWRRSRGGGR